jgi:hypothetical protein
MGCIGYISYMRGVWGEAKPEIRNPNWARKSERSERVDGVNLRLQIAKG